MAKARELTVYYCFLRKFSPLARRLRGRGKGGFMLKMSTKKKKEFGAVITVRLSPFSASMNKRANKN